MEKVRKAYSTPRGEVLWLVDKDTEANKVVRKVTDECYITGSTNTFAVETFITDRETEASAQFYLMMKKLGVAITGD